MRKGTIGITIWNTVRVQSPDSSLIWSSDLKIISVIVSNSSHIWSLWDRATVKAESRTCPIPSVRLPGFMKGSSVSSVWCAPATWGVGSRPLGCRLEALDSECPVHIITSRASRA